MLLKPRLLRLITVFSVLYYEIRGCLYYSNFRDSLLNDRSHVAALILARGGSQGISLKNIQKIQNNTLLGISLQVLKNTSGFNSIWVSTDHELIAKEAEKYGVNIHWRSAESATNEATSIFAVQEFLKTHKYINIVALIQCTSPFIKQIYLDTALKRINSFECVFSVTSFRDSLLNDRNHVAALILARGGSQGISLKNIQKIQNNTLLGISLQVLKNTSGFNSIWVSTDHELIAKEAEKYGVNIHWRSAESATNEATSIFAVQEFLKTHKYINIVALIQCTSPFIKQIYLDTALKRINSFECVFSVTRSVKLRWKKDGNKILAINFNPKQRSRRQDFQEEFVENGMFYFAQRKVIEKGQFQSNTCGIVEIPKHEDFEIDTYKDLILANILWDTMIH